MKKLTIFLISITLLTFSNSVFAGQYYPKRCKVEYTQLDLITGVETIYKETSQFEVEDHCMEGLERLAPKVYKWVDEKNTNIVTKINEFSCKVKNIFPYNSFYLKYLWGIYRVCQTYKQKLSAYLVDKYPNKVGANIYKEFNSIKTSGTD
jgi:hypothetical protein